MADGSSFTAPTGLRPRIKVPMALVLMKDDSYYEAPAYSSFWSDYRKDRSTHGLGLPDEDTIGFNQYLCWRAVVTAGCIDAATPFPVFRRDVGWVQIDVETLVPVNPTQPAPGTG